MVCEKGLVAGEQSGRNWGWVRQQGRDDREMPMIVESLRIWRRLEEEIGEDVGFSEQGILYLVDDDRQLERYAAWVKSAEDYDIGTRLIDRSELRRLVRGATVPWRGALYTASDGRAEPHKATPALALAAAQAGATILESCAVRGIESTAGRVSAGGDGARQRQDIHRALRRRRLGRRCSAGRLAFACRSCGCAALSLERRPRMRSATVP